MRTGKKKAARAAKARWENKREKKILKIGEQASERVGKRTFVAIITIELSSLIGPCLPAWWWWPGK